MAAEKRLSTYRRLVDARLDELLPSEDREPAQLHAAMRYSCLAPGKRIRPALCLASARAVGGDEAVTGPVLDAACATEIVHAFSLIHDDLPAIDDDALRRGQPTCHIKFGEAIALLAGDALFSLAFETLALSVAPPDRVVQCLRLLAKASGSDGLVGGEVVDVLSEGTEATPDTVRFIHERKTGALIAASCQIGAVIAGGTDEQADRLREYGERVGLAFQIADDLLNELSTAEQLGKAAGSDRDRQKATYPVVHGIEGARQQAQKLLEEASVCAAGFGNADELGALARYIVERVR